MGVTEQQLLEVHQYDTSEAFDDVERAALDLAVAMAKLPTDIPGELSGRRSTTFLAAVHACRG